MEVRYILEVEFAGFFRPLLYLSLSESNKFSVILNCSYLDTSYLMLKNYLHIIIIIIIIIKCISGTEKIRNTEAQTSRQHYTQIIKYKKNKKIHLPS